MKNTLLALAVSVALVPGIASAATTKITSEQTVGPYATEQTTVRPGVTGYMDRITETITRTVTRNARSDTEFHANDPIPGETKTDVQVRERVNYR